MAIDIDGNIYTEVTIGTQTGMVENLKTTKYNDGTPIPLVSGGSDWYALTTPGYCWYNNDPATYSATYGALYNWYTASQTNLAPTGWRVATCADWNELIDFVGDSSDAGGKLKEVGTAHWTSPNIGATDSFNFSALPGGLRMANGGGDFSTINDDGNWWTSTSYNSGLAFNSNVTYSNSGIYLSDNDKKSGFSIRCVKNPQIYVNLDNSATSGNGTSSLPYDINQLYSYVELSSTNYNIFNLKGHYSSSGTVSFWPSSFALIGSLFFKAWDTELYGPWIVEANIFSTTRTTSPDLNITLQDGVIKNNYDAWYRPFTYKNIIFYDSYSTTTAIISATSYKGCSFVNCSVSIHDYDGTAPDFDNSYLATNRFYDCVFYNSPIIDNDSPSASNELTFQSCLFSGTSADNFANVLTSGSRLNINDCTFDWIPGSTFPEISAITINSIAASAFNIPNTSATRSSSWVSGDYIYGAYNSVRTGPGYFYFVLSASATPEFSGYGHIGAFYFGPIEETISANILEISAVLLQPDVSALNSVSATIISNMLAVSMNLLQPTIYAFQDIEVDFVGVPRAGSSPLTVDFTANVIFSPEIKGKYKVKEYIWCFDYDYTNETCNIPWITTTQNPTTYVYTGYSGQTYSVKCCVKLELI
jgi:uncharacterized protein (TIGR02145 family)